MLERADQGIGRILAALERVRLRDRTLVIFTSDNGGDRFSRHGPLTGRKEDLLEGGIRVPALLRWPGTIPPGLVSPQVAVTMDWTATVLAATGTTPDPRHPLDGEGLLPDLRGARPPRPRTLHWRHRRAEPPQIQEALLDGRLKYLLQDERARLFDLEHDPGERTDLAAARPAEVARMQARHEAWVAAMAR
jgi:arylsulfatase A-like enzyme